MTRFKKIAVAALAVTLTGAVALPAVADRGGHGWGKGSAHGSGMMGGRHGRGQMAMFFMERFDTDADGKITQSEIDTVVAELYSAADADTSGGVSLDEFKAAYARELSEMKVRAFQRLDTDGDGSVTKAEFEARGGRGRQSGMMGRGMKGGGMNGGGMKGQGAGMMGQGQRQGQGQAGREARQEARQEMRAARQEARAKLFSDADENGDDALSLDEFEAVWVQRSDRRMVRMFQRLDRNGDLSVTKDEVAGRTSRIVPMMDSNGDGALSMEDHRRHHGGWGRGKRGSN
jgi:Ca2+-binding EF-hand superfamily protein